MPCFIWLIYMNVKKNQMKIAIRLDTISTKVSDTNWKTEQKPFSRCPNGRDEHFSLKTLRRIQQGSPQSPEGVLKWTAES